MADEGARGDSWRALRFLAVGIAAAAVILALPVGGDGAAAELTPAARNLGAIFALCVVLWATEAIPVAVTALLAVMVVLWVAGSWIKALDLTIVALCGAIVTFLPGMRLMDWVRAERFIGWNTLFMIGGVTSLGAASMDSGLAGWLVSITMGGARPGRWWR